MFGQDSSDQAESVAVDAVWEAQGGSLVALQESCAASHAKGTQASQQHATHHKEWSSSRSRVWGASVISPMPCSLHQVQWVRPHDKDVVVHLSVMSLPGVAPSGAQRLHPQQQPNSHRTNRRAQCF